MMRRLLTGLFLFALPAAPASAAWVHCSAGGAGDAGKVAYETTIALLRPATKGGKYDYPALLTAYIAHRDPEIHGVTATCASFEGNADAAHHYMVALNAATRDLGWTHVTVINPADWLPADAVIEATNQP